MARIADSPFQVVDVSAPISNASVIIKPSYFHLFLRISFVIRLENVAGYLLSIEGIKILTFGQGEQCCGFGGTFSVSYPYISKKVGDLKIEHVLSQSPDLLVSSDMSCLMHIKGLADKNEKQLEISHVIDVLHEAMNGARNE